MAEIDRFAAPLETMPRFTSSRFRHGIALVVITAAWSFWLLSAGTENHLAPFLISLLIVVILLAWFVGAGPAIAGTVLSLLFAGYFIIERPSWLPAIKPSYLLSLLAFSVGAAIV